MKKRKKDGYAVHYLDSVGGQCLLLQYKLKADDINQAVTLWNTDGETSIRTVIGVSVDGLIGSEQAEWRPDVPDAFSDSFVIVPWVQILGLLKRIPEDKVNSFFSGNPLIKH